MKVGFVTVEELVEKTEDIISEEFNFIDLTCIVYNSHKEIPQLVKEEQNKYNALMFAGSLPYAYAKSIVKPMVQWEFIPLQGNSLLSALLNAAHSGYNIQKISTEFISSYIIDVYNEVGIDLVNLCAISDNKDLLKNEILFLDNNPLEGEILVSDNSLNEKAYLFHRENYKNKTVDFCITGLKYVNEKLNNDKIPNLMVYPTKEDIIKAFLNMHLKYKANTSQNSQIVVLAVRIDIPDEYSVNINDEYGYILEREKITEQVYLFAHKIQAAVVQTSPQDYLLFSTKKILELETNNFSKIELFSYVRKKTMKSLVMGIGYGETAMEAKYNSFIGVEKAKKAGKNIAYVIYGDGSIYGPIDHSSKNTSKSYKIDERLLNIAEKSEVSINTIFKLYRIMERLKKDCFTSKELAEHYGMSVRNMNRLLIKLEDAGFAEVVGKRMMRNTGRPSRIIKINFDTIYY